MVRHLIHGAVRMVAAGEDPFAIHLQIHSADKLLIDLAKKQGRELPFTWGKFVKPEYKSAFIETIRETYNFLKHADKDHDQTLHVGEIATANILQLALCVVNYHGLFGTWTAHMQLIFAAAKFVCPDGFVDPGLRPQFDAMLLKSPTMTLADFFDGWWTDHILITHFPQLAIEKSEDLQDTQPLYSTKVSDLQNRAPVDGK